MVTLGNYPFWITWGLTALLLAVAAGSIPGRRWWVVLARAMLLMLSCLSASQPFLFRFVAWCFDHPLPPHSGRELLPLLWLFSILLPVTCFFYAGCQLRRRINHVATPTI